MKGFLELARENKRLREEVEQELSRVYESFSVAKRCDESRSDGRGPDVS